MTASYNITGKVKPPTFSPAPGGYGPAQAVSITSSDVGASIRYTLDGSTPTKDSATYTGPISVSATTTIKAVAIKTNWDDSNSSEATFTINGAAATPTFSVAEGIYGPAQTVAISTTTPGSTIYYTTNGSEPTTSSTVYSSAITISSTQTIKALATKADFSNSATVSATYTINGAVATPTASITPGSYSSAQSVTLSTTTPGASIYYTTDGTPPTTSNASYTGPISVATTQTIKAIAVKTNYIASQIASFDYTITAPEPIDSTGITTLDVDATFDWTFAGDVNGSFDITASGTVFWADPGSQATPDGIVGSDCCNVCNVLSSSKHMTLIGRIDRGAPFKIGSSYSSSGRGKLELRVNDTCQDDNGGKFQVTVYGTTPMLKQTTPGVTGLWSGGGTKANPFARSGIWDMRFVNSPAFTVSSSGTIQFRADFVDTSANDDGQAHVLLTRAGVTTSVYQRSFGSKIGQSGSFAVRHGDIIRFRDEAPPGSGHNYGDVGRWANVQIWIEDLGNVNGAVATPTASITPGSYSSAQSVTLSSATSEATIYYTVDGSPPTTSSATYSSPISVTATQTIKAIATKANFITSAEGRFEYTINNSPSQIALNLDFELGTIGWTLTGNMGIGPSVGDGDGSPAGRVQGLNYVGCGDDGKGSARSQNFYLPPSIDNITFLRAGGADSGSGFYLRRASDNSTLCAVEDGRNEDYFFQNKCSNLSAYANTQVYIYIADNVSDGWGKVYVDDIQLKDATNKDITNLATDQTSEITSLLLHLDGTQGSNSIIDSSRNQNSIQLFGNTYISTAQSKSGGSSLYIASNGGLYISGDSLNLASSDFTIDFWVYPTGGASIRRWLSAEKKNGITIREEHGRAHAYFTDSTLESSGWSAYNYINTGSHIAQNSWQHIAISRSGSNVFFFRDGALIGSTTISQLVDLNGFSLGANEPESFIGYVDEFRIIKNKALYTTNFNPPSYVTAQTVAQIEYLVVGGGGGGSSGGNYGGGGGGGQVIPGTLQANFNQIYTVTVGAGGSSNSDGENSVFGSILALKGGRGSGFNGGTSGGGNAGRPGGNDPPGWGGGGGGGAGSLGSSAGGNHPTGGNGGSGVASSITGISALYGGGGGGSSWAISTPGLGSGGGGNGGRNDSPDGNSGTPNSGGGGGGATNSVGGSGGSGVVILAYVGEALTISSGLSYTLDTTSRPSYKIYKFTSGSGQIALTSTNDSPKAASFTCPTNYVKVQANATLGTSEFCVAKYEMKNVGNIATSQALGNPWVTISRNDSISRCQALGANYDLISNAQRQAMTREIETAQSQNGNYLNWSNNSQSGSNYINRGHSDDSPPNALSASADNDPCSGTGNTNCVTSSHTDFTQKRTHTLKSGEIIWDASGNVWEWVKDDNNTSQGVNSSVATNSWSASSRLNYASEGAYPSKNSGEYGGLGVGYLDYSAGAVIRGGAWWHGTAAGLFMAWLNIDASYAGDAGIGFRCVYNSTPSAPTLLLHFDGPNGSTTITDSSKNSISFAAMGDARISTGQNKFGGTSGLFDGMGDYITTPSSALFGFGAGDFTVEAWVYLPTLSGTGVAYALFDNRTASISGIGIYAALYTGVGGTIGYRPVVANNTAVMDTGSSYASDPTLTISAATWTHIAVTRQSGTVRLFVNGSLSQTVTDNRTYDSTAPVFIGANGAGNQGLNGYIDELRVIKGVALYTSPFTPSSAAYTSP